MNLFENYTQESIDMEQSLRRAGYTNITVVLNDDGFLPSHIHTPLKFFLGEPLTTSKQSFGKFFNEVQVPNFWEIRGGNQEAEIFEGYKKRGKINYSKRSGDYRIIKSIDWYNELEKVRSTDLYNQFGELYGKKTYSDGELVLTTLLNDKGLETILINHITGTVQLNYKKNYVFTSYIDFILFYFQCAELNTLRINYNNLGLPYFITLALEKHYPNKNYAHTLFWHETSQKMPGNMKGILEAKTAVTDKIIIQNRDEFLRLKKQIPDNSSVSIEYLGLLYKFKRTPKYNKSILILTNSDQIENLTLLVDGLSQFQFNIAARTEMSQKLMHFETYSNIHLYPNIETDELDKLMKNCAIYFDINHGSEVESIVRKVFEAQMLIFAFSNTSHNRHFTDRKNIFDVEHVEDMIKALKYKTKNKNEYRKALAEQLWNADLANVEDYREILK